MERAPQTIEQIVGDNVLRLRKAAGWSQTELAFKAGLSQRAVSNTEQCGGAGSISLSTLAGFASAFRLPVSLLVMSNIPLDGDRRKRTIEMLQTFDSLSDYAQLRVLDIATDYRSIFDDSPSF